MRACGWQVPIPKKRTGNVAHDKALQKFYRATYEAVLRHINFANVGGGAS